MIRLIIFFFALTVSITTFGQYHFVGQPQNDTIELCGNDSIVIAIENANGNRVYGGDSISVGTSINCPTHYNSNDTSITVYAEGTGRGYIYAVHITYIDTFTINTFTDSIYYIGAYPYQKQRLCLITVDTVTGKNEVIFEPTHGQNIAAYKIYKQNNTTSDWDSVGVVPKDSMSTFIDYNSNPAQQNASYAITIVNDCNNESSIDTATRYTHTTIHLSSNLGTSGEVNLSWNAYVGFSYSTFAIYRSNNGGTFTQIGNTANNVFSYSDLTPPSGTNRYYVAIEKQPACDPSRSISSTISNILNPAEASGINDIAKNNVSVYPNPFTDKLTISPSVAYTLYDVLGRAVYNSEDRKGSLSALPIGTYILKTEFGSTRVVKM